MHWSTRTPSGQDHAIQDGIARVGGSAASDERREGVIAGFNPIDSLEPLNVAVVAPLRLKHLPDEIADDIASRKAFQEIEPVHDVDPFGEGNLDTPPGPAARLIGSGRDNTRNA